ncbi:hypothetical protein SEA_OBLADI_78 [Gordonia phage ObLaDi]|uniref:Uncharacterized protein n=2 Tax=Cafassovirus TaxID=3425056 RepID=A0A9E7QBT0_9CAUD|nr:hypothetical protein SEA_ALEEMILY_77 [Gordonia phage Aleemily]UXE03801.1 hypothetical protein SEA_OBLADI_78 [Gordonia phage ObLaDi]
MDINDAAKLLRTRRHFLLAQIAHTPPERAGYAHQEVKALAIVLEAIGVPIGALPDPPRKPGRKRGPDQRQKRISDETAADMAASV